VTLSSTVASTAGSKLRYRIRHSLPRFALTVSLGELRIIVLLLFF